MAAQADVAVCGEQAGRVLQVLHAQRQPVQRAQRRAARHLPLGLSRGLARALEIGGADRIDSRVQAPDACNAGVEQLDR